MSHEHQPREIDRQSAALQLATSFRDVLLLPSRQLLSDSGLKPQTFSNPDGSLIALYSDGYYACIYYTYHRPSQPTSIGHLKFDLRKQDPIQINGSLFSIGYHSHTSQGILTGHGPDCGAIFLFPKPYLLFPDQSLYCTISSDPKQARINIREPDVSEFNNVLKDVGLLHHIANTPAGDYLEAFNYARDTRSPLGPNFIHY